MSYEGAGSAAAAATEFFASKGDRRGRLVKAVLAVLCMGLFIAPAMANAAEPTANDVFAGTNDVTPVVVHFNASDPDGDTLTYAIGDAPTGGSTSDLTQTGGGSVTYTADSDFAGTDTFTYTASDESSTAEANVSIVVRPQTAIDAAPDALTTDNTPSFDFSSPQTGTTFECKVDAGAYSACTSGFTTSTLSDGNHTVLVRAVKGSLKDPTPAASTFKVDATAPTLTLAKSVGQGDPTKNAAIDFSLTSDEPLNADTVTTDDFSIVNGTIDSVEGTGDTYTIHTTAAADGDVSIDTSGTFEVADIAGNTQTSSVGGSDRSVIYDTVVSISIDSAPVDGNLDGKPSISFSSSEDPDVTYQCRLYETTGTPSDYSACDSPYQTNLLDKNVSYTFDVIGTDVAGNTDTKSTSWLQSNTAPVAPSPDETLEAGQSVTVHLGSTDADSDVLTYSIINPPSGGTLGAIDQGTGDVVFTADADGTGSHIFDFSVSDSRSGGTVSSSATVRIQPNTTIDTRPNEETNNQTPTWTYSSPAGGTTFECAIDADPYEPCDGGSFTPSSALSEGPHTFSVRATNGALTDPTPATDDVIIDITKPTATITAQPVAISNDATPAFEFETDDATATLQCSLDASEFAACTSGDPLSALAEGDHTFIVRAVDPGGNISDEASYTWEVDLTNPAIALGAAPNGPGEGKQTNAKRPIWSFDTTDINLDSATITCWVDSQTPVTGCLTPFQPSANLADGTHTLHITAMDVAGNTGTFDASFKVNTLSASVAFSDTPDSPSGPTADFAFTASTDLGAEGKFECRTSLNGGAPGAWATCESPLHLTGLSSGTRKLEVRAVDSAGNASTGSGIASHTWTTIGGTPDTTITGSSKTGTTASFGFNSAGNPLATFECKLDSGAFSACTSPKTYTGLSTGSHTFSVRATNQVGSTDASPATNTWSVSAPTAPNTNITSQPSASTAATDASFSFASSAAVSTFECSLDGGDFAACESPKAYTGLAVGDHTFKVRATSGAMTDASPASVTWTIVTANIDPPVDVVCNPRSESPVVTNGAKVSRALLASVTISHRSARAGQTVTVTLNGNGKKKAKLAKVLKSVVVTGGNGATLATLKGKSWASSFTVSDSQGNGLSVSFKRKKGKAIKKPAAFTALPACPAS